MIATFLPYVKCLVPIFAVGFLVLAFAVAKKLIKGWIISRPIPPGGFPSIEAEISYINDEPMVTRRHWKYRSWFIFAGVACLCLPLSYFVPVLILKVVMK